MKSDNMNLDYLKHCVYYEGAFDGSVSKIPGMIMATYLDTHSEEQVHDLLSARLVASCRKLLLMWVAGERVLESEVEFYSSTLHDAPALYGKDAVALHYHLEMLVLSARSALDVAARIFGLYLPPPFKRGHYDSFNRLVKSIVRDMKGASLGKRFENLRLDPCGWLSIIADTEKGRSVRDKIAHQTEFPISYMELHPPKERESAVVLLKDDNFLPLPDFVETLRSGVISGFVELESVCVGSAAENNGKFEASSE